MQLILLILLFIAIDKYNLLLILHESLWKYWLHQMNNWELLYAFLMYFDLLILNQYFHIKHVIQIYRFRNIYLLVYMIIICFVILSFFMPIEQKPSFIISKIYFLFMSEKSSLCLLYNAKSFQRFVVT